MSAFSLEFECTDFVGDDMGFDPDNPDEPLPVDLEEGEQVGDEDVVYNEDGPNSLVLFNRLSLAAQELFIWKMMKWILTSLGITFLEWEPERDWIHDCIEGNLSESEILRQAKALYAASVAEDPLITSGTVSNERKATVAQMGGHIARKHATGKFVTSREDSWGHYRMSCNAANDRRKSCRLSQLRHSALPVVELAEVQSLVVHDALETVPNSDELHTTPEPWWMDQHLLNEALAVLEPEDPYREVAQMYMDDVAYGIEPDRFTSFEVPESMEEMDESDDDIDDLLALVVSHSSRPVIRHSRACGCR